MFRNVTQSRLGYLLLIAGVATLLATAVIVPVTRSSGTPSARTPVVFVIFDALPIRLLRDGTGHIDEVRYPNFARLAAGSTWYRNATTISESTRFSVPAMLDGLDPRPRVPPDYNGHPVNLFTLLHDGGYRLSVQEDATRLCPEDLCGPPDDTSVLDRLRAGRAERFRAAVRRIDDSSGSPQLNFIHALLPHEPRSYLPDGRLYEHAGTPKGISGTPGMNRRYPTKQVEQRTLLQLQFADRLLGELLDRLELEGVYDRAMIVAVSDHGESFAVKHGYEPPFKTGQLSFRRRVTKRTIQDLAAIAMFVKYPHQRRGRVDDRMVRSIDVLPTILEHVGLVPPPGLVGRRLDDPSYRGHREVSVYKQSGRIVAMSASRFRSRAHASKRRELARFGRAHADIYSWGPRPDLVGLSVDELQVEPRGNVRAEPEPLDLLAHVRTRSEFLPAFVTGHIRGGRAEGRDLVYALNGEVVATGKSYRPVGPERTTFSIILPPKAFHDGANELEIFQALGGNRVRRLFG